MIGERIRSDEVTFRRTISDALAHLPHLAVVAAVWAAGRERRHVFQAKTARRPSPSRIVKSQPLASAPPFASTRPAGWVKLGPHPRKLTRPASQLTSHRLRRRDGTLGQKTR